MSSFIITWNPQQWPYAKLKKLVLRHSPNKPARTVWRFRSHRRAKVGDLVFLYKQGKQPRGIFGFGTIIGAPRLKTDATGREFPVAPVMFSQLVDPTFGFLVDEAPTREVLSSNTLHAQASGMPITDGESAALIGLLPEIPPVVVPEASAFAAVLADMEASGRLSDSDRSMLTCHYNAPGMTLTASEMSALMGWSGQTANRFYGGLGRRLSEELRWVPEERKEIEGYYVSALVIGRRPKGAFEWTMRPQLARALEILSWPYLVPTEANRKGETRVDTVTERAAHVWQQRLERDSRAAQLAKAHHGYRCMACEMTFSDIYGELGTDFIEAHHLIPLANIVPNGELVYTVNDFAVLCSNCHRMIHRWPDRSAPQPWDIKGFTRMVRTRRRDAVT